MSHAVDGARRLLRGLTGEPTSSPSPSLADVERWRAQLQAAPSDDEARAALWSQVHAQTLPDRLADAIAEDHVDVVLADGSSLPRAAAERALALKEERGVYRPLRGPLLKARRRALDPVAWRVRFDAVAAAHGLESSPSISTTVPFLRAFLTASAPLARPALEVLEAIAGPIDDGASFERALDRPAGPQSADAVAVELVRLTRPALPPDARPLQRRTGPRALQGHVVDDGENVRVLWAESHRLRAQRALLRGVGRAYARLAGATSLDGAVALTLQSAPLWRAVGTPTSVALSLWREAVAAGLLEARLAAAVVEAFASAELDPEAPPSERLAMRRDATWRAAAKAVSVPVGDVVDEFVMPPWPDGAIDVDATRSTAARAMALVDAAMGAMSLREVGDEGLLLRPRGLLLVREAGLFRVATETEADANVAADAWRTLLGEVS